MKILYMAHSFPPTGYAAAVNTYRIVKGLVNKGHKLIVFCSRTASKHAAGLELQDENRPYPFDVYYSFPTPLLLSVVISHLFNASKTLGRSYDMLITQFARARGCQEPAFLMSIISLQRSILLGKCRSNVREY